MMRLHPLPIRRAARQVAGLLLLSLLLAGSVSASQVPTVAVSIKPLHSLLAGLMQGIGEPRLLIDGRVPPWRFEPDATQRKTIATVDLLVWSGGELEPGLVDPLASRGAGGLTVEVLGNEALKVLPARHDERRRDPMFWLDSRNMLLLLDVFARLLIDADPDRAPAYERNWQRMTESLSAIDRVMEFGYRDVSGVPVFFYYDTHQYFAQAYAMHLAGAVLPVGGRELPDAARLLDTRAGLQAAGAACLFTEQALEEPNLDLLLSGGGTRVVELDSFGATLPAGPDLYVELMRANFNAISRCVRALKPQAADVADAFEEPDVSRSPDRLRPRYLMMDQHGRSVSHEDFRGRLQLIYFGYTFCPDICPTSLAVMAQALRLLGEEAEQVQPIFITVDPQRDTPALLAEYVKYFHPRLLGLSASPQATKRIAELFRARYERVPAGDGDPARYSMDHTASLFLLGRNGEFITKFAHGLPADEVAERLRTYLRD